MPFNLLPVPEIPPGLREVALRGNLIPFIGAGVSRIAGSPGWNDFADAALRWLIRNGGLSYSQLDQVQHLPPRVKLSLARTIAREKKLSVDYAALLHPIPKADHQVGRRLYDSLFSLGKIFVTTNYDLWLDEQLPAVSPSPQQAVDPTHANTLNEMRVVYQPEDFLPALLSEANTVIHLHGSVRDPERMVLTTSDYIDRYSGYGRSPSDPQTENRVLTFLDHLFNYKTVLFVGYGLEELEVLEYILEKGVRRTGEARHYMLQGFYSHQEMLMQTYASYYLSECGIDLISFRRDEKDWDQLAAVLADFAREMPATSPMILQQMQEMAGLLNE